MHCLLLATLCLLIQPVEDIDPPTPGDVVEISRHTSGQVWSLWLGNGVRFHFRHMDTRPDEAFVAITVAAGELLEGPTNHGISRAATLGWAEPATERLDSGRFRGVLRQQGIEISTELIPDAIVLRASASAESFEAAMQLVHLLLTEPRVEQNVFDRWVSTQLREIETRSTNPNSILQRALLDAIAPPLDRRLRFPGTQDVRRLTRADAQAWLDTVVAPAPLEAAITGDLTRDRAFKLAKRYLASLPPRPRLSPEALAPDRTIQPIEDPETQTRSIPGTISFVVNGFFGPDFAQLNDVRRMRMAAWILDERLRVSLRDRKQLVYWISVRFEPSRGVEGFGLVLATATAAPANRDHAHREIKLALAEFARTGPTEEEAESAREFFDPVIADILAQPDYWSQSLASLTYRDFHVDDLLEARGAYRAVTTDEIRATFARYHDDPARIVVLAGPDDLDQRQPELKKLR